MESSNEWSSWCAHLGCLALDTPRLVHEDIRATTHCNLPRCLINSDRLELFGVVDVNGLKNCLRTAEDDQRVARYVRLRLTRVKVSEQDKLEADEL